MSSKDQEVSSLLTEHFRYTPLTLIDDIINTVNELIYRAVTAVETGLTNTPSTGLGFHKARAAASNTSPDTSIVSVSELDEQGSSLYPEKQAEIETGVHKLETLLESSVDKNFDKFEIYVLRNILSVRDGLERWMRLEHYQDLEFPIASSEISNSSPEKLLRKRRELGAARRLNASLTAEQRRNESLLSELRRILGSRQALSATDFIGNISAATDHAPDAPDLSFLLSIPGSGMQPASADPKPLAPTSMTAQNRALLPLLPHLRTLLRVLHEASARDGFAPDRGSAVVRGDVSAIEGIASNFGSKISQ